MTRAHDIQRISEALDAAVVALAPFTPGAIDATMKQGDDPVTAADLAVNEVLLEMLPRLGEGWLSEETEDDPDRLRRARVWIVDPIDGTREFVQGVPEWCVSIGLIENGQTVAGGITNPATGERIVGSVETGVEYSGNRPPTEATSLTDAVVLASRSEVHRGEWDGCADEPFSIIPMGSVAFKTALVAAGRADATWTLVPKHEWDVAAGAALVEAARGCCRLPSGETAEWNRPHPLLPGFVACTAAIAGEVTRYLDGPNR